MARVLLDLDEGPAALLTMALDLLALSGQAEGDLRLRMLSTPVLINRIRQAFAFQTAGVGAPLPTFGTIPATIPPGIAFDVGTWTSPEGQTVPIRFLHVEPRRIVIDIPGPSAHIARIYEALLDLVQDTVAPDGSPVIGQPRRKRDYSEVSVHLVHSSDLLIPLPVRHLVRHTLESSGEGKVVETTLVLSLRIRLQRPDDDYQGAFPPDLETLVLELRADVPPRDQVYFSAAPLTSEAHLEYLSQLDRILAEQAG